MKRKLLYVPTLRCQACKKIKLRNGLKAWFFQPPMPTNGRGDSPGPLYFICSNCRLSKKKT